VDVYNTDLLPHGFVYGNDDLGLAESLRKYRPPGSSIGNFIYQSSGHFTMVGDNNNITLGGTIMNKIVGSITQIGSNVAITGNNNRFTQMGGQQQPDWQQYQPDV
jgi:hypothetical protein